MPIIYIVVTSFYWTPNGSLDMATWSLEAFRVAVKNESLISALQVSILVAFVSSAISTLLGVITAIGMQGSKARWTNRMRKLFFLPLMLPEIVIGMSLLLWFVMIRLVLGHWSLILAHVTFTVSYSVVLITLSLESIENNLFEAAKDLGADSKKIFLRVTLPLLRPSIIGAFFLCFVISFDDFLISYFTAGVGVDTLPMKLYSLMRFGITPELRAISTLILSVSFILTFVLQKMAKRFTIHKNRGSKVDVL
jgi:spermidine/putrescine transport system permease protein